MLQQSHPVSPYPITDIKNSWGLLCSVWFLRTTWSEFHSNLDSLNVYHPKVCHYEWSCKDIYDVVSSTINRIMRDTQQKRAVLCLIGLAYISTPYFVMGKVWYQHVGRQMCLSIVFCLTVCYISFTNGAPSLNWKDLTGPRHPVYMTSSLLLQNFHNCTGDQLKQSKNL